jgi:hypothetical protein
VSSRRRGRAVEQYARASTSSPSGCTGLGNGTIQGFEHPTDSFQLVGPLPIHDSSLFAGEPTELNKRVSARSAAAHRARWCRSPPPTFRARSSRSSPRPRSICGARARGASCLRSSPLPRSTGAASCSSSSRRATRSRTWRGAWRTFTGGCSCTGTSRRGTASASSRGRCTALASSPRPGEEDALRYDLVRTNGSRPRRCRRPHQILYDTEVRDGTARRLWGRTLPLCSSAAGVLTEQTDPTPIRVGVCVRPDYGPMYTKRRRKWHKRRRDEIIMVIF